MIFKRLISIIASSAMCLSPFAFGVHADTDEKAVRTPSQLMNMDPTANIILPATLIYLM